MAERDKQLDRLPGALNLGWSMFMRPAWLHERLAQAGVNMNKPATELFGASCVERQILMRMGSVLIVMSPVFAITFGAIPITTDFWSFSTNTLIGALVGSAFGVVIAAFFAAEFGIVTGVLASGAASFSANLFFNAPRNLSEIINLLNLGNPSASLFLGLAAGTFASASFGANRGIGALGFAVGAAVFAGVLVADQPIGLAMLGIGLGIMLSIPGLMLAPYWEKPAELEKDFTAVEQKTLLAISVFIAAYLAAVTTPFGSHFYPIILLLAGFYLGLLRFPIWIVEVGIQLALVLSQRVYDSRALLHSPIFFHEGSILALPWFVEQVVGAADSDLDLADNALAACDRSPWHHPTARRIRLLLGASTIRKLAEARSWQSLAYLRGPWLPTPETASSTLLSFSETARYLRAAEVTLLPSQRRQQLESARDRLNGLENSLRSARRRDARAYHPALKEWQRLVDDWLAQTDAEAARVLPNPFRAWEPLEPEFGREVFRGREPLVMELEGILGDPSRAPSLALIGPRRCGKTSLLKMLREKLPDTLVLFFDVQDQPVDRPAAFVQALVSSALDQARRDRRGSALKLPGLGQNTATPRRPSAVEPKPSTLSDSEAFPALRDWIERLETESNLPRILLCIDEFERLEELYPDDGKGGRRALKQLLGLIRATIQHRRRVRILVAGAAPFEELDAIWNDHFVNLRELAIGHLDRETVLGLLSRPSEDFPPDCIPAEVADAVWLRTLGQPFLTQLYGLLIVERLNQLDAETSGESPGEIKPGQAPRKRAELEDVAAVEPLLLDRAGYYLRHLVQSAPEPARLVLERLAAGEVVAPASVPGPTRRWLQHRWLLTDDGRLGIPVLGRFIDELD